MTTPEDQVIAALGKRVTATPIKNGCLLTTPFVLDDHTPVDLAVTRLGDNHYLVSDRGLIADRLDMAGARIDSGVVKTSWEALTATLPAILTHIQLWEIAATTDSDGLGDTVIDVAAKAMQADMLRILAPAWHPLNLSDELSRQAASMGAAVTPRASVPTRNGGQRHVSFSATGKGGTVYVKALGSSSGFMSAYDSAYATFATMVSPDIRASIIGDGIDVNRWQWEDLSSVSRVMRAGDCETLWREVQGGKPEEVPALVG